jgi:dihydrolipoamide dehydrogenase
MVVGQMAEPVDLLVIGGGPGGYVAALRAAELGREVVVVERGGEEGGLGGSCLHVGCIPSKALIELGQARERIDRMQVAGLRASAAEIDLGAFQEWKRSIVDDLAAGIKTLFDRAGVRHIMGTARFASSDRVAVTLPDGSAQFLEFRHAMVATGSRPAALPGLEPDGDRVLTSTGALALEEVPGSLSVVGAGYIGLELGTAFAKLGASVSVVEALDRVLPSFDRQLTRPVMRRLSELGIELQLEARVAGLDEGELILETEAGERRLSAERVVVAVGRVPNTDDLGLDAAGVAVDERGLVPVDERRLATPRIAAIGDITTGPALAHKASAEGMVAAEALCGRPSAFEPLAVPAIAFTDPEVASAGLTEDEARAAGMSVAVGRSALAANGRAATLGERGGFARVVIDRNDDRIVGVQVVGPHASELVTEGALAVEMIASPGDLAGTIHPHPTLSESLHAAVERIAAEAEPVGREPEEVASARS